MRLSDGDGDLLANFASAVRSDFVPFEATSIPVLFFDGLADGPSLVSNLEGTFASVTTAGFSGDGVKGGISVGTVTGCSVGTWF